MKLMKQYQICVDDFKLLSVWCGIGATPPKTNMEPENEGSRKESPLPGFIFSASMLCSWGRRFFFKSFS